MRTTDEDYLRWLESPEVTLGTGLRLEIARRFRELIDGQVSNVREADVPKSNPGSTRRQENHST